MVARAETVLATLEHAFPSPDSSAWRRPGHHPRSPPAACRPRSPSPWMFYV